MKCERVAEKTPGKAIEWSKTGYSEAETSSRERTTPVVFLPPDLLSQRKANRLEQRIGDMVAGCCRTWCLWIRQVLSHKISVGGFHDQLPSIHIAILPSLLPLPVLWGARNPQIEGHRSATALQDPLLQKLKLFLPSRE